METHYAKSVAKKNQHLHTAHTDDELTVIGSEMTGWGCSEVAVGLL